LSILKSTFHTTNSLSNHSSETKSQLLFSTDVNRRDDEGNISNRCVHKCMKRNVATNVTYDVSQKV